jgi:hypothetical protein
MDTPDRSGPGPTPPGPQQEAGLPPMREILGPETSKRVAEACRKRGIQMQARKDRQSAFFLYKIARLFE